MGSRIKRDRRFNVVLKLWLGVTMFILFFPIVTIIIMSFNSSKYGTLPFEFTFSWYKVLFGESELIRSTIFSLWFSAAVSTVSAILGIMSALALRQLSKKWNKVFPTLIDVPLIIPWLVQGVALLLLFNWIGIGRSMLSMFMGNLVAVMPHAFLLVYSRVMTMSPFPEEAGKTLGAKGIRVFVNITFPMIFPAVLAGWLMSFVLCFNCFSLQYYLAPFGTYTLPMEIFTLIRSGCEPDINAMATIMCLITFIAIILLNKIGFSAEQLVNRGRRKNG